MVARRRFLYEIAISYTPFLSYFLSTKWNLPAGGLEDWMNGRIGAWEVLVLISHILAPRPAKGVEEQLR